MPKKLEKELIDQARKKGLKGERLNAYVYGALRKTGWTPSKKKTNKKKTNRNKKRRS